MTYLESVLGGPFAQLKFEDLQRLIDNAVPEGTQLDFKRDLYGDGESLATDVVALANTIGGALIIGVDEKEAIASFLNPVPLSDETERKMRQWLASYTTPPIDGDIRRLPLSKDASRGGYVIDVPRSSRAPHAVVKGITLKYYRRAGSVNHSLSESEVADAYYSRFSRIQQQEQRLETITGESTLRLQPQNASYWVAVTLLPTYAGSMEISAEQLRAIEGWATKACEPLRRGMVIRAARAFPFIERVLVTTRIEETEPAIHYLLHLYTDGAASVAAVLVDDVNIAPGTLYGSDLVRTTASCLRVVAEHAVLNTGARGSALVRSHLIPRNSAPLKLGEWQHAFWEQYPSSRAIPAANPIVGSPRAIDLDAILARPADWLVATRLVLTDIMHAFGLPEVLHINEDGSLNTLYWRPETLDGWKAVADIPRNNREIRLTP